MVHLSSSNNVVDEIKSVPFGLALLAELVGTCMFVFFACGFIFVTSELPAKTEGLFYANTLHIYEIAEHPNQNNTGPRVDALLSSDQLLRNSLALGILLGAVVLLTRPISGGHVNPAVSLSFMLLGKISIIRFLAYILAQCLGAAVAAGLLYGALSKVAKSNPDFACTYPSDPTSDLQAVIIEAAGTFFLVFAILAICKILEQNEEQPKKPSLLLALAIFASMFVIVYVAGPFTGASVNPARSFGPAIVFGCWHHHHVYWFGPIIGAIVAAVLFYCFTNPCCGDKSSSTDNVAKTDTPTADETKPLLNAESKIQVNAEP